jgi:hypothetical protein
LDKYFIISSETNIKLDTEDLHLYGLVTCFISSKLEELYPIRMEQILYEAGHGKFSHVEILSAEKKIY